MKHTPEEYAAKVEESLKVWKSSRTTGESPYGEFALADEVYFEYPPGQVWDGTIVSFSDDGVYCRVLREYDFLGWPMKISDLYKSKEEIYNFLKRHIAYCIEEATNRLNGEKNRMSYFQNWVTYEQLEKHEEQ